MDKQKPVEIAAVWKSETRDGKQYWSGYLGSAKLLIFHNQYKKEGDRQPDLRLYVVAKEQKKDESSQGLQPPQFYNNEEVPF